MANIIVDCAKKTGNVKPMHGVNNGPIKPHGPTQRMGNFDSFKEAGFPFARTHDSAFCGRYGGMHTIDVANIFVDFDKDPYDEKNYDFVCTDLYIEDILLSGAEVFYRLGTSIEHYAKKYNCKPPKDYKKYAIVCEHIIRHYTEGWANGFKYNIKYWEIWNEPDTHVDGLAHEDDPSWTGTPQEFFEFFDVMYSHLKECFPHLLIGGPAAGGPWRDWVDEFLSSVKRDLDFFTWHSYTNNPRDYVKYAKIVREKLKNHGFNNTLSILGEWNYAKGWNDKEFEETLEAIKGIKGASFALAAMAACQYADVDILLYYDARPCAFNGIYDSDIPSKKLKGYYSFYNFNKLYGIGESVSTETDDENLYSCAAYKDGKGGVMLTYFNTDDELVDKDVDFELKFEENGKYKLKYYFSDKQKTNELIKEEVADGDRIKLNLTIKEFDCYYIEIEKI